MTKEEFCNQVLAVESSMYRMAKSILKKDEDCADVIQNAILKAYSNLGRLQKTESFKAWITRIVINESYLHIRKTSKYVSLEDYPGWEASLTTAEQERPEESPVLQELLKLDEKYRIPIVLQVIEGYSVKEISKMLHLSETNVRNRVFRGKRELRKRLEGERYDVG